MRGRENIEYAKRGVWIFVAVFTLVMLPHQGWSPTAAQFTHTYALSEPPGQLTTERGTFDFIAMFSLAFVWLIPISAAFMASYVGVRWIELTHMIITFLLWCWFIAVFLWQLVSIATANPNPFNPADAGDSLINQANDDRWCNVYGPLGIRAPCYLNTFNTTSSPYVGMESLGINPSYLFTFIMNLLLVVLITIEFFWVMCSYRVIVHQGFIQMMEPKTLLSSRAPYKLTRPK
ncbi:MAG TPA: hypothetical protein V6D20_17075, partial [Candidatus Obscuribacterales bacterium]